MIFKLINDFERPYSAELLEILEERLDEYFWQYDFQYIITINDETDEDILDVNVEIGTKSCINWVYTDETGIKTKEEEFLSLKSLNEISLTVENVSFREDPLILMYSKFADDYIKFNELDFWKELLWKDENELK